jgi:hypothetical protein
VEFTHTRVPGYVPLADSVTLPISGGAVVTVRAVVELAETPTPSVTVTFTVKGEPEAEVGVQLREEVLAL